MMAKAIGGFFEFELLAEKAESKDRFFFNSGRSAFAISINARYDFRIG